MKMVAHYYEGDKRKIPHFKILQATPFPVPNRSCGLKIAFVVHCNMLLLLLPRSCWIQIKLNFAQANSWRAWQLFCALLPLSCWIQIKVNIGANIGTTRRLFSAASWCHKKVIGKALNWNVSKTKCRAARNLGNLPIIFLKIVHKPPKFRSETISLQEVIKKKTNGEH